LGCLRSHVGLPSVTFPCKSCAENDGRGLESLWEYNLRAEQVRILSQKEQGNYYCGYHMRSFTEMRMASMRDEIEKLKVQNEMLIVERDEAVTRLKA